MNFTKEALFAVLLLGSSSLFCSIDAFAPSGGQFGVVVTNRRNNAIIGSPASDWQQRSSSTRRRMAAMDNEDEDDDDDEELNDIEPLSEGVDSVSWLPTVLGGDVSEKDAATVTRNDSELLPLFPLGGIVYTPNSEHILNIFEPRYRQMYTDILMNGTKRFAVSMSHPTESGRFAEMAVLFELEDLKEVSEQTGDQIKYICNHKVTGRVKLHRVLNPQDWESRDTYLRVEGTILDDSSTTTASGNTADAENVTEQRLLRGAFADLVDLQHDLEEDVRFTRASVLTLSVNPGSGEDGLWQTIKLWQSFADQRLMARQNELQKDFQDKLQEYLKKDKGMKGEQMPSTIGFQDLSPELQQAVVDLQKRMATELQPLVLESTLTMQKILECADHTARLQLVRSFIEAESSRLKTKKTIKGVFSSAAFQSKEPLDEALFPLEELISDDSLVQPESFFSDDDAFQ